MGRVAASRNYIPFHFPSSFILENTVRPTSITTDWVAYKQQQKPFICHSSGCWMSEVRVPAWPGEALFQRQTSLCVISWWKGLGNSVGSLTRALILIMGVPPVGPNHLPEVTPSNTITLGPGFSCEFLGTHGGHSRVFPKSGPSLFWSLTLQHKF